MPEPVQVAVVGAGIGRAHVEGYLAAGAQVVALCDLDAQKSQSLADKTGIAPQIVTDYRVLLENDAIDAVSICVPNALHAPLAIAFLRAGKHVLCEKPLATNALEAQKIADAARKNGKVCMVSQVLRFRDDIVALKAEIESGKFGEIYYARAMARRVRGIPKWGGWFTQQKIAGGGPLIDTGVHILDLAWWLSGSPRPVAASGVTYAEFGPYQKHLGAGGAANEAGLFDVEDLAAGLVRFENGLSIHFEAAWAIHAQRDERFCHLHGTQGAILWDDAPKIIDVDGVVAPLTEAGGNPWAREMAHFLDCIGSGKQPDPDANQGVTMMKILDALYQSARENREISI
ncbi:MAG: Gfo/Idh/MocA family oxidoreductase [Armatimonadetes bacterium]|nr:Gfo/Idh/MocA family oxidoreductase [Armatimonadota bacterium]